MQSFLCFPIDSKSDLRHIIVESHLKSLVRFAL